MVGQKHFRCAIYTRKSHEEGLDQEFNSLQAQSEACAAYIASQAGLGWTLNPTLYDDGGLSGGHMNRPALKALIRDIKHGLVDIIVVYKVDRLTRSLTDFARLVEVFDAHQVSFVSVTQAFNTTSSMGRLTLNVLLSFAQFEREVTAERIRDKIAASKKKGMWMGGQPPLGYTNKDKKLIVVKDEAVMVRQIFALYRTLGTVRMLKQEVDRLGLRTKQRKDRHGAITGGKPFTRGHLYALLNKPVYAGRVQHKGHIYPGAHQAIIEPALWADVQAMLAAHAAPRKSLRNHGARHLLTGLLFDPSGDRLSPSHASKKGKRYRYYISQRLMRGQDSDGDGWRLPAPMIEELVKATLIQTFSQNQAVLALIGETKVDVQDMPELFAKAGQLVSAIQDADAKALLRLYHDLISTISISKSRLEITLHVGFVARRLGLTASPAQKMLIMSPVRIKRRGHEMKMLLGDQPARVNPDNRLIRLVAQAHDLKVAMAEGRVPSIDAYAAKHNLDPGDARRLVPLGTLAPGIVEAIMQGRQPVDLTVSRLRRSNQLPILWSEQRSFLGFDQNHQIH